MESRGPVGAQPELLWSHVAVLRYKGTAEGQTGSQVVNAELTLAADVASVVSMAEGKPEARIWPHEESKGKEYKKKWCTILPMTSLQLKLETEPRREMWLSEGVRCIT